MIQLLGDCPPDPYKGSALGRHWILESPDPYFCTHPKKIQNPVGGGMATGLKTSSCFDKVASILLPLLATMSPVSATLSPFLATLSLVWTGLYAASKYTTAPINHTRPSPRKHSPDVATRARKQTSDYSLLLNLSTSKG